MTQHNKHDHDENCTCHHHDHHHDHHHGESCSHHSHDHGDSCGCQHESKGGILGSGGCECCEHAGEAEPDELKRNLIRLIIGAVLYVIALVLPYEQLLGANAHIGEIVCFLIPYFVLGYGVIWTALKNISRGKIFDENFLMCVATIGALALQEFPEAVAVMLFYQIGELFEDYAVGKSRKSIGELMDIRPDHANVIRNGAIQSVDPQLVELGETILVKPGERIPLDGNVVKGATQVDTSALTGESVPSDVKVGDYAISGAVNLTGAIEISVDKAFGESTVSRILELVENASEKKSQPEAFITRFARYYTPIVCGIALLLAFIPPLLFALPWSDWVYRALVFLVVSCPCALVVSVPLSFFGGIGGASHEGILVKGSNYLEALSKLDTVVFDKTGTLTQGVFDVVAIHPEDCGEHELLEYAAFAESYSDHPIAQSIRKAFGSVPDATQVSDVSDIAGQGITAHWNGHTISVGNDKLMSAVNVEAHPCELTGTILHVCVDGRYLGHIVIADVVKPDSAEAISGIRELGVAHTVMLTGDRSDVAAQIASSIGIDEYKAELLPKDKVDALEGYLARCSEKETVAFVGDGINDAPVLMRADVGIAMGAIGSDAAIEAADVVLMDDKPSRLVTAIKIARKTLGIVYQNIVGAIGIKVVVLLLAAVGLANMWAAVFADVGVLVIAILNAMRALRIKK